MNSNFQKLAIWVAILVLLAALFNLFNNPAQSRRGDEITYSEFLTAVEAGKVADATIAGNRISGTMKDAGGAFQTYAPEDPGLVERLRAKDVNFKVAPRDEDVPSIMSVLLNGLRILSVAQEWQTVVTGSIIILAVYIDMLRRRRL